MQWTQNRNGPHIWCWCCERLIPRTEPVYRCRTCTRGGGAHHHGAQLCADCWAKPSAERRFTQLDHIFGGLHTYICTQLLSPWSDETRAHPQPCDGCGRPVVTGYNDYRRWTVCSEPCRVAARREHQRAERVDDPDRCVGCGAPMPGCRRGRRWCSPACRQRAYRQRTTKADAALAEAVATVAEIKDHDAHDARLGLEPARLSLGLVLPRNRKQAPRDARQPARVRSNP